MMNGSFLCYICDLADDGKFVIGYGSRQWFETIRLHTCICTLVRQAGAIIGLHSFNVPFNLASPAPWIFCLFARNCLNSAELKTTYDHATGTYYDV